MPILLLILALLALPSASRAQEAPDLRPGIRLRVTHVVPPLRVQVGRLDTLTDTSLVLSTAGSTSGISRSSIRRLEVSGGHRPNYVAGVIGLVVGAAAGGLAGCAANRDSYGVFCGGQSDTKVAIGATIGGLTGAAAGAFLFRRERWIAVDHAVVR